MKKRSSFKLPWTPFGAEYAWRPTWGLWERFYIRVFGLLDLPNRLRARIVLPKLKALRPEKVLDLGSGTGCYSFYLSRDSRIEVAGVEIDKGRVLESSHIAKCLGRENLKFYCGNAKENLQNFPSETFQLALTIEILQYLVDVNLILKETYRVLKPGGVLLGHVPVLGFLRPEEKTLFDNDVIQQMLSRANFQIVKIIPTFGRVSQGLCALYDFFSHSRTIVAALFPLILLASAAFRVENPKGRYRFFVARKPAESMTEDRRIRTEDRRRRTDESRLSAES